DSLSSITASVADLKEGEQAWIQLVVRPISNYWQEYSKNYLRAVRGGRSQSTDSVVSLVNSIIVGISNLIQGSSNTQSQKSMATLSANQEGELASVENKSQKQGFEVGIRVVTKANDQFRSEQLLRGVVAGFK